METILMHSSSDHSISPYEHFKNSNTNYHQSFVSRRSENHALFNYFHDGLLYAPPPSLSYSSLSSYSYPPPLLRPQRQPPLLPLPISNPNNVHRSRGVSCPPINRKNNNNRAREQKKSKYPKKADPKPIQPNKNPLGPDPKDLPKDVSRVLLPTSGGDYGDLESSEVFTLSPPPSSLPLPTFSLRPKLSCKAEAVGVDAGATDNLRRIHRLP